MGAVSDVRRGERNVSRRHAVLGRDEPSSRERCEGSEGNRGGGEGHERSEGGDGHEGGEGHERSEGGGEGHEGSGWWVEDAGSFNGTYVNGRLIRGRTPLAHDACVQVGDVLVTLRDTTGAAAGAPAGRFEPASTFLRAGLAAADAPARLVLLQGPGVGSVLRLDGGPVSLGGVPGSTLRLDAPGCEAIDVVIRPLAQGGFEVVRRGGPAKVYVSVRAYERRLLWNNDVLLLEHDDGRVLSELRFREAGSVATARLPGTPLPVGTEVDALPPSWAHWLVPAEGPTGARSANPSGRFDQAMLAVALAEQAAREAALAEQAAREAALAEQAAREAALAGQAAGAAAAEPTAAVLAEPAAAAPLVEQAATAVLVEPAATAGLAEPAATARLAEPPAPRVDAEGAPQEAPTSRSGAHDEPQPAPASKPSGRIEVDAGPVSRPSESGAGAERRARRARWAIAASLTLALGAAAGAALWPRSPAPRTPEASMGSAARLTAEPTQAAVEPIVEPVVEGPASPGAALAMTEQTPGVRPPGVQRTAIARAPRSEGASAEDDDEEARLRARLENKARRGAASATELRMLRRLCSVRKDDACQRRVDRLLAQEEAPRAESTR